MPKYVRSSNKPIKFYSRTVDCVVLSEGQVGKSIICHFQIGYL